MNNLIFWDFVSLVEYIWVFRIIFEESTKNLKFAKIFYKKSQHKSNLKKKKKHIVFLILQSVLKIPA